MQREIYGTNGASKVSSSPKWIGFRKQSAKTINVWQNEEEKEISVNDVELLENPPPPPPPQEQQQQQQSLMPSFKSVTVDLNLVTNGRQNTTHYYSDNEEEEHTEPEDYGDNRRGLPSSNLDASVKKSQAEAQELRNLNKARQMNVSNRSLRNRNRYTTGSFWKPWQKWILTIILSIPGQAYMPQWFRRLFTTTKGFGRVYTTSSLWNGVYRQNLIKKTKAWLKKIGYILIACAILWFFLPMIFSSSTQTRSKLQAGMVKTLFVRIDDAGISMTNPLSLTDLLYDRSSKTMKIIQKLHVISEEVSNKMLQQGFGDNVLTEKDRSLVLMKAIKETTIKKAFSAYHQNELWVHFIESKMISKPKDMVRRLHWLQHHCSSSSRKTPLINSKLKNIDLWIGSEGDEKTFPEIAKTYGYLEIDVTELIDPLEDEDDSSPPSGSRSLANTQKQIEKNNRLNKALQNLAQDGVLTTTTENIQKNTLLNNLPQLPMLPSPESLRRYRNVSLNDVNILMRFLAVETHKAWLEITSSSESNSIPTTVFDISILSASFWSSSESTRISSEDETHYQPITAMEKTATNIIWNMDQSKHAEIRGEAIWTGMATGCICAHHIGLPLPGVAWVDSSNKKTHALFYPNIGKIKESDPSSKKGFLFSSLQGMFGADKNINRPTLKHQDEYPMHQPENHPLEFIHMDPVLINSKHSSSHQYLGHTYWIEGYDYKGFKRRVRVKSPELACISSCLIGCSP